MLLCADALQRCSFVEGAGAERGREGRQRRLSGLMLLGSHARMSELAATAEAATHMTDWELEETLCDGEVCFYVSTKLQF